MRKTLLALLLTALVGSASPVRAADGPVYFPKAAPEKVFYVDAMFAPAAGAATTEDGQSSPARTTTGVVYIYKMLGPLTFANGTQLTDDGANSLAQKNGTTVQAFHVYGPSDTAAPAISTMAHLFIGGTVVNGQVGAGGESNFANNSYYNSGWKYLTTGKAGKVGFNTVSDGCWSHQTAISGTKDAAISWVEQLRICSTGVTFYKAIATAGLGFSTIYGENISTTQTANFTALTYTPPATAGRYEVSADITTTSSTNTGTVQITVDYVDSQGTTHTADVIPLVDAAGSLAATKTGASKEFHSLVWKISINNAGSNIVIKVVITGSVSYTVSPSIVQIA